MRPDTFCTCASAPVEHASQHLSGLRGERIARPRRDNAFFIAKKSPGNLAEASQTKFLKIKIFRKNQKNAKISFLHRNHGITTYSAILTKSIHDAKYRHIMVGNVSFALHWCNNDAHMQKQTFLFGFQVVPNNI